MASVDCRVDFQSGAEINITESQEQELWRGSLTWRATPGCWAMILQTTYHIHNCSCMARAESLLM